MEHHEENKNKDLSSTVCEYVGLECTPQVQYICAHRDQDQGNGGDNDTGFERFRLTAWSVQVKQFHGRKRAAFGSAGAPRKRHR